MVALNAVTARPRPSAMLCPTTNGRTTVGLLLRSAAEGVEVVEGTALFASALLAMMRAGGLGDDDAAA